MKVISLVVVAAILILVALFFIYKPIYSVTLNGEFIGYCQDKTKLQSRINNYMDHGDGENIAFVEINNIPEYKMCLLKKGIVTDDDGIFEKIKDTGVNYYTYYAIKQDEEEKYYVSTFQEAEEIINELKEKDSANQDSIQLEEKYSTELKEFSNKEVVVAELYVEKPKQVVKRTTVATTNRSSGSVNTSTTISSKKVNLGISLIQPVSGRISSKFGSISRMRSGAHTGLDIATSYGTPIKAAASGTVTFAGWKGSYGNLIVVSHGNGVQTYYGHCSSLVASVGQTVSQGQVIAKVGSTGNSSGNHLHLEIRVNGTALNPQNYLY